MVAGEEGAARPRMLGIIFLLFSLFQAVASGKRFPGSPRPIAPTLERSFLAYDMSAKLA
jgi:hypothetical protein